MVGSFWRWRHALGAPFVAPRLGRFKQPRNFCGLSGSQNRLDALEFVDETIQSHAELLAVRERDVPPHLRGAGRDARRVAKAIRAQRRLMLRMAWTRDVARQRCCHYVREMAR